MVGDTCRQVPLESAFGAEERNEMIHRLHVLVIGLATLLLFSSATMAQSIMDGTLDESGFWPEHSALQGTSTSFGDNDFGQPGFCNGSELNAIHVTKEDGYIMIFLAGNLESNFNKLDIFIDARQFEGQNQLQHNNPDVDFEGLRRMGNTNENMTDGLTFDEGFAADLWLSVTCGDDGNGGFVTYASFAELYTDGDGNGAYLGSGSSGNSILNGENGIQIAIDNSNVDGVGGGNLGDCGDDVTTGVEIAIPEFVIDWFFEGLPLDDVKVCAFLNGSGHDYVSNQVLPGIPPSDSLGDPRGLDFNTIPGLQYAQMGSAVTECPEFNYGGCCLGEVCVPLEEANCLAGGGEYLGTNVPCDENSCVPPDCATDVNDDGITDVDDLLELLGEFGQICS